jgi:hypothetical protein
LIRSRIERDPHATGWNLAHSFGIAPSAVGIRLAQELQVISFDEDQHPINNQLDADAHQCRPRFELSKRVLPILQPADQNQFRPSVTEDKSCSDSSCSAESMQRFKKDVDKDQTDHKMDFQKTMVTLVSGLMDSRSLDFDLTYTASGHRNSVTLFFVS